jgi:cytidyltransferase-like protein
MSQVTQANKVRAKVNADESGRRVRLDSQYEHVDSTALRALTEEFEAGIRKLTDKYNGERETGEGNEKGQLSPEELLHCVRQALSKVVTGMFSEQLGRHVATLAPAKAADGLEKKQVVGYIDGCFDVMHSGHYNALRQAASICDKLVVGVHTDAEILKWKGPTVMNDEERKATVLACKWVDELAFGTPYNPDIATLDKYGCDFSIHGDDLSGDTYKAVVDAGRFRVVKRTAGVSTTDLVGRLLLATKTHHMNRPDQGMSVCMCGCV